MATHTGKALIDQMARITPAAGSIALWGLGQMGLAVKGARTMLYIDPCLSDLFPPDTPADARGFKRVFDAPVLPHQVTNADYVLCSHEHLDHTDPYTLDGLCKASPQAGVVITGWSHAPCDAAGVAPGRRIVADQATLTLGEFTVTPVPSAHYARERTPEQGERWLGFLIQGNGVTLYHSGDTIIYPGYVDVLRALPRADIVMLPCNGRDAIRDAQGIVGNLFPVEAAWLAQQFGWDMVLAGHNDLFAFNALPPGEVADGLTRLNPRQKWRVLQPGELMIYAP
jgi:L-ascorbate metabolism protein UlaG (beta-lactamase superfamily)